MSSVPPPSTLPPSPAPSSPGTAGRARNRVGRAWIATLVVVAVVAVAAGLTTLVSVVFRSIDARTYVVEDPVSRLAVNVNGQVSVRAGDRTEVTYTREWGLFGAPEVVVTVTEGLLRVDSRCRAFAPRCLTHASVTIAPQAPVAVVTSTGTVTVTGTTGGVDLRTSAGAIDVEGVSGSARLRTSAGSIRGTVASGDVDAQTSAGRIELTVGGAFQRLAATSSAGEIDLTVPDDVYRVDALTPAGSADVQVRTDPTATRQITAHTGAGSIVIRRGT